MVFRSNGLVGDGQSVVLNVEEIWPEPTPACDHYLRMHLKLNPGPCIAWYYNYY